MWLVSSIRIRGGRIRGEPELSRAEDGLLGDPSGVFPELGSVVFHADLVEHVPWTVDPERKVPTDIPDTGSLVELECDLDNVVESELVKDYISNALDRSLCPTPKKDTPKRGREVACASSRIRIEVYERPKMQTGKNPPSSYYRQRF